MSVTQGQTSYPLFPAFAEPGQLADLAYQEIQSFPAAEVVNPGRAVEIASDNRSCQQAQQTSSTFSPLGVSVLITARESQGPVGVTGLGVQGIAYQIGDMVPVLLRGRVYAEWKGTTQPAWTTTGLNVYHSSTIADDRGKFTDAATATGAGVEIAAAGAQFRTRGALPGTGNIILLDVNLPGAAS